MGILVFSAAFLLYSWTAIPLIFYEDNPEFLTTAYTLGVSHPSGYPLINMLGNLAGMIPIGSFAFRANLLSSFFGALAAYLFSRCVLSLTKDERLSAAAALAFMASGNIWTQASILEVYTLHYSFFFGILWISLSGRLRDFRWLLFSSFLFGMAVTNHLSFSLSLVPFTILWLGCKNEWEYEMGFSNWAALLGAGLLSWCVHLYLPARSLSEARDILFSWGRISDIDIFIGNITGSIYSDMPFNIGNAVERVNILTRYFSTIPLWIWLPAALLFFLGMWKLLWKNGGLFLAMLTAIPLFSAYTFLQYAALDILMAIPWGLILIGIAFSFYGEKKTGLNIKGLAVFALPALMLFYNFPKNDRHADYSAYNYLIDALDTIPEGGKLKLYPGYQENYIFLYGTHGPLGAAVGGEGEEFSPYGTPGKMKMNDYGLLSTFKKEVNGENVWKHIRSGQVDAESFNDFEGGFLTRDAFKGIVASRIALQRGIMFRKNGEKERAEEMMKLSARFSPENLLREASVRSSWGETELAIKLLETVMNERPSAEASSLLAQISLAKNKKKKRRR